MVGAGLSVLHLHCPEELALERIKKDQGKHAAKNRDPLLYFLVKSYFEPITLPKLEVDTSRPLEECVAKCIDYLTTGSTEGTEKSEGKAAKHLSQNTTLITIVIMGFCVGILRTCRSADEVRGGVKKGRSVGTAKAVPFSQ